jgi:CubicO group peptidase (beta-lactamase class C family)
METIEADTSTGNPLPTPPWRGTGHAHPMVERRPALSPPRKPRGWVGHALGWIALAAIIPALSAAPSDISEVLEKVRAEYKLPALAAAVVRGTNIVSIGAVGVRRLGSPEKAAVDDKFHIGSCTKSMTATLAAMMVENGTIQWTNTLGDILTDLAPGMNPQYRDDPLELLLANRGGVPGDLNADGLWGRLWERAAKTPLEQRHYLAAELTKTEPAAKPGTKFIYANAGFALGGHLLEVRAGKPWEQLLRERLFEPLGMTSAGFGAPASPGKIDQPWGHSPAKLLGGDSPVEPGLKADNPAAIGPGGTVHCSIGDLARYAAFHLQGARGQGQILKPESFRKLHTALAGQDYAMGWVVTERPWGGGKVLTHTGSNTMFYTVIWIAPERDFAVVVSTNLGGPRAEKGTDAAAWALIQQSLQ